MADITLDGIGHAYGGTPKSEADYALKPIHHVWESGKAYALLGPSGCGKTTLLNIISGLVIPSHGRLLFGDRDVTRLPTEQRNIAQVFQFPVIYDTMTVAENLAFPLKNRGMARAAHRRRVGEIAAMLDLVPDLGRRARGLTADAKQKISLGRGLVRSDVSAVLFDEPLTVIDPALKWELRSKLKAVHRALDLLMIYVTHDQVEALTFADKVVVMNDGRAVQIGTPAELFERPEHTFVGYFIGSPGMNLLRGEVAGAEARVDGHVVPLGAAYPGLQAGQDREARHPARLRHPHRRRGPARDGDAHRRPRPQAAGACQPRGRRAQSVVASVPRGMGVALGPARLRLDPDRPTSTSTSAASRGRPSQGEGRLMDTRVWDNRAWLFVVPVMIVVLFSSLVPMMTVVNYSVPGHDGAEQLLLERRRLVPEPARSHHRGRRALPGRAAAQPRLLGRGAGHRGAARHRGLAVHPEIGLEGRRRAGADRPAAAHPLQRRGRHLAAVQPHRHRPARRRRSTLRACPSTSPRTRPRPGQSSSSWTCGTGPRCWRCCATPA